MTSQTPQPESKFAVPNRGQVRLNTVFIWGLYLVLGGSFTILVMAITAPLWFEPASQIDFLRSLGNLLLDFLERFYHEPEMDII